MTNVFLYAFELWKVLRPMLYVWRAFVAFGLITTLTVIYQDWVVTNIPAIEKALVWIIDNSLYFILTATHGLLLWSGYLVWSTLYKKTSALNFRLLKQNNREHTSFMRVCRLSKTIVVMVSNQTEITTPVHAEFLPCEQLKDLAPMTMSMSWTHVSMESPEFAGFPLEIKGKTNVEVHLQIIVELSANTKEVDLAEKAKSKLLDLEILGSIVLTANSHLGTFKEEFIVI